MNINSVSEIVVFGYFKKCRYFFGILCSLSIKIIFGFVELIIYIIFHLLCGFLNTFFFTPLMATGIFKIICTHCIIFSLAGDASQGSLKHH